MGTSSTKNAWLLSKSCVANRTLLPLWRWCNGYESALVWSFTGAAWNEPWLGAKKNAFHPPPEPPTQTGSEMVADYERLRREVLASQTDQQRSSPWVLLVRQGMAAWVRAGRSHWASPTSPVVASVVTLLPQNLQGQVAQIWANMVLSRFPLNIYDA
jgi:hypothetical protein